MGNKSEQWPNEKVQSSWKFQAVKIYILSNNSPVSFVGG
jgi:hypothetical protein